MPVFGSTEEAEDVFATFMAEVSSDDDLRPKFVKANTSFRVNYVEPACVISLDATQDPPVVKSGDAARAADVQVEMSMSTDDAHKFWLGELNVPMAMAKKKITVQGPIGKLLKMLPALQPAFSRYRVYLQDRGMQDKLS
jgi:putative sterol carrier protein